MTAPTAENEVCYHIGVGWVLLYSTSVGENRRPCDEKQDGVQDSEMQNFKYCAA